MQSEQHAFIILRNNPLTPPQIELQQKFSEFFSKGFTPAQTPESDIKNHLVFLITRQEWDALDEELQKELKPMNSEQAFKPVPDKTFTNFFWKYLKANEKRLGKEFLCVLTNDDFHACRAELLSHAVAEGSMIGYKHAQQKEVHKYGFSLAMWGKTIHFIRGPVSVIAAFGVELVKVEPE